LNLTSSSGWDDGDLRRNNIAYIEEESKALALFLIILYNRRKINLEINFVKLRRNDDY